MRLLEGAEGKREICVISDFQATGWEGTVLAAPPGIDVATVRVGEGAAPNLAIGGLYCDPPAALAGGWRG